VAVDADHLEARQPCGMHVGFDRAVMGNAELVALQSGGNVRVRLRVDVRIDADADRRAHLLGQRHLVEHVELGFALDVEAGDAGGEGLTHLGARLADAREDDLPRIRAHGQHARQLTARDDVETAAGLGEHAQHAERGVGLHRVADQRLAALEAALVGGQRVEHPLLRIDEQRRAVRARQRVERDALRRAARRRAGRCAGWPGRTEEDGCLPSLARSAFGGERLRVRCWLRRALGPLRCRRLCIRAAGRQSNWGKRGALGGRRIGRQVERAPLSARYQACGAQSEAGHRCRAPAQRHQDMENIGHAGSFSQQSRPWGRHLRFRAQDSIFRSKSMI
jgi:hypothetical protein